LKCAAAAACRKDALGSFASAHSAKPVSAAAQRDDGDQRADGGAEREDAQHTERTLKKPQSASGTESNTTACHQIRKWQHKCHASGSQHSTNESCRPSQVFADLLRAVQE